MGGGWIGFGWRFWVGFHYDVVSELVLMVLTDFRIHSVFIVSQLEQFSTFSGLEVDF
jgi:hypothetical protein